MIFPEAILHSGKVKRTLRTKIITSWKSRLDRASKNTIGMELLYPREGELAAKGHAAYRSAASARAQHVVGIIDFNIQY